MCEKAIPGLCDRVKIGGETENDAWCTILFGCTQRRPSWLCYDSYVALKLDSAMSKTPKS